MELRVACYVKAVKNTYSLTAYATSVLMLFMIVIEIMNIRTYLDEIIGLISLMYVAYYIFSNYSRLQKQEAIVVFSIAFIIIWGVISNITSGVSRTIFSILVDAIAETKVMACFFVMRYLFNEERRDDFLRIWYKLSKCFLFLAFIFGVLTLFVNTGMYSQVRYGIPSYHFVYEHAFQFTTVEIAALIIVELFEYRRYARFNRSWLIVALISLGLTTKAPAFVYIAITVFLIPYLKKNKKISFRAILLLGIMILLVGGYQIENYLLKADTPRNLFTVYSIRTANDFFPFGSGFATFGSDQAARNYSPLYEEYGFTNMWGLGKVDGWFLSDNFWQAALAQFGWIGFIVYLIPYIYIYRFVALQKYPGAVKTLIYANILQFYVHAFGSAILSSASGVIGFMVLGIILCKNDADIYEKDDDYVKVN